MRVRSRDIDVLVRANPKPEASSKPPVDAAATERLARAIEALAAAARPQPARAWSFAMQRDANNLLVGVIATPMTVEG